jgi:acetyl esterase/lipase
MRFVRLSWRRDYQSREACASKLATRGTGRPASRAKALVVLLGLLLFSPFMSAAVQRDLTFARVGDQELKLDLYLPDEGKPAGLIVWVHGGAWRGGSRDHVDVQGLTALGWAIASVDYRLSTVARFPAQIHDIKAAIRYLRANAATLGFPANRFVVAGSSAGAHLAALVGVTNGDPALEGSVGDQPGVSSDVQAILDLYGASDLTTILGQSSRHGLEVRVPALDLLLGGQPDAVPALARLASPVFQLDAHDPPLFLLHGEKDDQMPPEQSHQLAAAYEKLGQPLHFEIIPGAGHGGPAFTTAARLRAMDEFLRQHLAAGPAGAGL